MPRKADGSPAEPLAWVFAELWEAFTDHCWALDGADLERLIETSGLAFWRPATEEDVKNTKIDLEVGDAILCLTDEGRDVVNRRAKLTK